MKTLYVLAAVIFFVACSTPEKTTVKKDSPKVTRADMLRGGTSFSNAVVIMVEKERAGLDEEYRWLNNNYPGYTLVRRTHVQRDARHYDIVRIKAKGQVKDIYFDSTRFWGKN